MIFDDNTLTYLGLHCLISEPCSHLRTDKKGTVIVPTLQDAMCFSHPWYNEACSCVSVASVGAANLDLGKTIMKCQFMCSKEPASPRMRAKPDVLDGTPGKVGSTNGVKVC